MGQKAKAKYDWEAIEKEYRLGQLSNYELSKNYCVPESSLRYRAKKFAWSRDLTPQVRQKIKDNLLRSVLRTSDSSDDEIVEIAAKRGSDVIVLHRDQIGKTRETVQLLLEQLVEAAKNREEIKETIEITCTSEEHNKKRSMLNAVSLQSHSTVAANLSNSLKVLINLERQAYNLNDEKDTKATTLLDILDSIDGASRGLPNG